jgi:hypothetical protein
MTEQEAKQLVERYGSIRGAAKAVGLSQSTFRGRLHGNKARFIDPNPNNLSIAPAITPAGRRKKPGMSEAEFMGRYDSNIRVRNLLKQAVRLIEKNRFYPDHELRRMVHCGDCRLWRDLASDPDEGFTKHQFIINEVIYWSDPESVTKILKNNSKTRSLSSL